MRMHLYLTGVYLTGVHLMDVYLMGVSHGRVSHGRISRTCTHRYVSYECTFHEHDSEIQTRQRLGRPTA
jgi:hypothetical protein